MKITLKFIRGAVVVAGLATSATVAAKQASTVLPIGTASFPPFRIIDEPAAGAGTAAGSGSGSGSSATVAEPKIYGIDTEMVEAIFAKMGKKIALKSAPWKRIYADGEAGKYAAVFAFTTSPEREKAYYLSQPINVVRDVFFKRKADPITWKKLEDLIGKTIGISDGYSYFKGFMEFVKSAKTPIDRSFGANPEMEQLRKLAKNRVDVFICEVNVCSYLLRQNQAELAGITYIDHTIGVSRAWHVGFSKKFPGGRELRDEFNKALAAYLAAGERDKVFKKYHVVPPEMADGAD